MKSPNGVLVSVRSFIGNCDPVKLTDLFIERHFKKELIVERYKRKNGTSSLSDDDILAFAIDDLKKSVRNCITEVSNLNGYPEAEKENTILGVVKYYDHDLYPDGSWDYDVFAFHSDELKEFNPCEFPICETFEDVEKSKILPITSYSFIFEDWRKVVDYQIPHFLIKEYGAIEVAAAILYEMTWCGFDYQTAEENRNKPFDGKENSEDSEEIIETDLETEFLDIDFVEPYDGNRWKEDAVKNRNSTIEFFIKIKKHLQNQKRL